MSQRHLWAHIRITHMTHFAPIRITVGVARLRARSRAGGIDVWKRSPPGARGESTQSLFSPRGIAQNTLSRRAQHRTTGNTRIHSHFLQPCQCSAFSAAPGSSRSLRWVAMYMAHSNGRNVTGTLGQLMFSEAQLWACSNEAPIA